MSAVDNAEMPLAPAENFVVSLCWRAPFLLSGTLFLPLRIVKLEKRCAVTPNRLMIAAAVLVSLTTSANESAAGWWKEEREIYSYRKGECATVPPFSSEVRTVVIRYDWSEGKAELHIDLSNDDFPEEEKAGKVRTVQVDDGDPFDIYSASSPHWVVTWIFNQDRFFDEFGEGKTLLMFLTSGKMASVDLSNIEKGAKYFIRKLRLCNEDQRTGGKRGPHYP